MPYTPMINPEDGTRRNGMSAKRVANCFPREAFQDWPKLDALREKVVIVEHVAPLSWAQRWPGKQKNVLFWCEIEGGLAIGWNENPASGWTFPIIKHQGEAQ